MIWLQKMMPILGWCFSFYQIFFTYNLVVVEFYQNHVSSLLHNPLLNQMPNHPWTDLLAFREQPTPVDEMHPPSSGMASMVLGFQCITTSVLCVTVKHLAFCQGQYTMPGLNQMSDIPGMSKCTKDTYVWQYLCDKSVRLYNFT